jgi:hypothetical protein
MNNHNRYVLTKNIEHYLAIVAKLYAQDGEKQKQEIIVNAQVRVHEAWSSDNWNGGTYGHALYLIVPEAIYLGLVRNREDLQLKIKEDINKIHNVQNEFIEEVFIEMEVAQDKDWRKDSGLLMSGKRIVLPDAEKRIWGDEEFRLFLSHKTEVKQQAAKLKEDLKLFGVSCFVAHEDIHPTQEWQNEIENALSSMDVLVALMTENFHDSLWTDQEVGFAFGRGVPIISVRLGKDPYGFIGKFQALTCTWEKAAIKILKILIKQDRMLNAYIKAVESCNGWDYGNVLAKVLPFIDHISEEQEQRLLHAYNENGEVTGSFGFNGGKPSIYGQGLAFHLSRLTGKSYNRQSDFTLKADR